MDLHDRIMRLPDQCDPAGDLDPFCRGYKHGHRDARHAAAELALKADACIEALRAIVASTDRHESGVSTFLLIDAREALSTLGD